jgi:hypothetical protein
MKLSVAPVEMTFVFGVSMKNRQLQLQIQRQLQRLRGSVYIPTHRDETAMDGAPDAL